MNPKVLEPGDPVFMRRGVDAGPGAPQGVLRPGGRVVRLHRVPLRAREGRGLAVGVLGARGQRPGVLGALRERLGGTAPRLDPPHWGLPLHRVHHHRHAISLGGSVFI